MPYNISILDLGGAVSAYLTLFQQKSFLLKRMLVVLSACLEGMKSRQSCGQKTNLAVLVVTNLGEV